MPDSMTTFGELAVGQRFHQAWKHWPDDRLEVLTESVFIKVIPENGNYRWNTNARNITRPDSYDTIRFNDDNLVFVLPQTEEQSQR
jgi:hypothetical protein